MNTRDSFDWMDTHPASHPAISFAYIGVRHAHDERLAHTRKRNTATRKAQTFILSRIHTIRESVKNKHLRGPFEN